MDNNNSNNNSSSTNINTVIQEINNRLKNIEDNLNLIQNGDLNSKIKELKDLFTIFSQVDEFNIKKEFDKFFNAREKAKKTLYLVFIVISVTLFGIGVAASISSVMYTQYSSEWKGMIIFGPLIRDIGIAIYSTIPSDEIDIFQIMIDSPTFRYSVVFLLLFGTLYYAVVYGGIVFPYILFCVGFTAFCVQINSLKWLVKYHELVYATNSLFIFFALLGLDNIVCYVLGISNSVVLLGNGIFWMFDILYLLSIVYSIHRKENSWKFKLFNAEFYSISRDEEGWGSKLFNTMLYNTCFATFIGFLLDGFNDVFIRNLSSGDSTTYFFAAFCDIIPILGVLYVGPNKFFSLLARSYEFSARTLQSDGANMAFLLSKVQVYDRDTMTRWCKRKEALGYENNDRYTHTIITEGKSDFIKRQYWLKGKMDHIPVKNEHHIPLKFSYSEDIDYEWQNFYETEQESKTTRLVELKKLSDEDRIRLRDFAPKFESKSDFSTWLEENFELNGKVKIEVDRVSQVVTVWAKLEQANDLSESKEKLLDWAVNHLRKVTLDFEKDDFGPDLFLISPRQMGDDNYKDKIYNLSKKLDDKREKIDFFISHSWEDKGDVKHAKLKEFCYTFEKRYKRAPTFWLDKTCIDQRDPKNSITVLPVNIAACDKMLVLLSKTYMKRLWCIWELFTLFTFCNKESFATERIEIRSLEDDLNIVEELRNFDINKCHCFAPDEEYKLRFIITEIGIDRIIVGFKTIADIIENNEKLSNQPQHQSGLTTVWWKQSKASTQIHLSDP